MGARPYILNALAVAVSLPVLAACGGNPENAFRTWPDVSADFAFLLTGAGNQSVHQVSGSAFTIEEGVVVRGVAMRSVVLDPGQSLVMLGIDQDVFETLPERDPSEDLLPHVVPTPDAVDDASLIDQVPSEQCSYRWDDDGASATITIPVRSLNPVAFRTNATDDWAAVDPGELLFLDTLQLQLPVEPTPCAPARPGEIRVFDPAHQPLLGNNEIILGEPRPMLEPDDPQALYHRLGSTAPLDEDRLVVTSRRVVYLFERGKDFTDDPSERIDLWNIGLPERNRDFFGWRFQQIVRDPVRSSTRADVLYAVADAEEPTQAGAIIELSVDATGLHFVRTATLTRWRATSILLEDDGWIFVGGQEPDDSSGRPDGAHLIRAPSIDGPYEDPRLPENVNLNAIVRTTDPARPHALLRNQSVLMLGDAKGPIGNMQIMNVLDRGRGDLRTLASRGQGRSMELWVGSDLSDILHRKNDDDPWEALDPVVPTDAAVCASSGADTCGITLATREPAVMHLLSGSELIFTHFRDCQGALFVSTDARCSSVIPKEDGMRTDEFIPNATLINGRVLMGGNQGELWEYFIPEEL